MLYRFADVDLVMTVLQGVVALALVILRALLRGLVIELQDCSAAKSAQFSFIQSSEPSQKSGRSSLLLDHRQRKHSYGRPCGV